MKTLLDNVAVASQAEDTIIVRFFNSIRICAITVFTSILVGCSQYAEVTAVYETAQVKTMGDAADDPAIWVNTADPSRSLIFGTDKKDGVYVYTLNAKKIGFTQLGNINNIDVRTSADKAYIVASNRTNQTVDLWVIDSADLSKGARAEMFSLSSKPTFSSQSAINIYGACAGLDPEFGLIAFITEDEGPNVEVWRYNNERLDLLTTFNNGGESEGCVFDDENRVLFISEEETNGVLKAYQVDGRMDFSGFTAVDSREGFIAGDPEGVGIYKTTATSGYVVLSSQGDSTFNIYDRLAPHRYRGSFVIAAGTAADGKPIDGVSTTDGIEVINLPLNEDFPEGLLIVQDDIDSIDSQSGLKRQNFKLVSFAEILKALDL